MNELNPLWKKYPANIPEDDQNVLVIHSDVQMLPIKAFYCDEWKVFCSLESDGTNVPLHVTHWIPMPTPPTKILNE